MQVSYMELFRFLEQAEKLMIGIACFCAICLGTTYGLLPILLGNCAKILSPETQNSQTISSIEGEILIFFLLGLSAILATFFQFILVGTVANRLNIRLRNLCLQSILNQEMAYFDTKIIQQLSINCEDDCKKIVRGLEDKLIFFLMSIATFLTSTVIALVKGVQLTLILIIFVPICMWADSKWKISMKRMSSAKHEAYSKAGITALQALSSIKTVVSLCGELTELSNFKSAIEEAFPIIKKSSRVYAFICGLLNMLIFLVWGMGFYFGSKFLKERIINLSPSDVLTICFAMLNSVFKLSNVIQSLQGFQLAQESAYRMYQIIDRKSLIDSYANNGLNLEKISGEISFQNVSFEYPSKRGIQVLKNLNLRIKAHSKIAIVGESGCGKSTCLQLLMRFYDVDSGTISVDDLNLNDINIQCLRNNISYVNQEPILFSSTILENLKVAKELATETEILEALKKARALEFVMGLPDKLNTYVGIGGTQLSGGQKQRIAIARAILKDAPIILLDEATSALDRENEKEIQEGLDQLASGRTCIIVAHRLSTLQGVQYVYVFNNEGSIQEEGTPEDLLIKQGKYYELFQEQALIEQAKEEDDLFVNFPVSKIRVGNKSLKNEREPREDAKEKSAQQKGLSGIKQLFEEGAEKKWPIYLSIIISIITGGLTPYRAVFLAKIMINLYDPYSSAETTEFWALMFFCLAAMAFLGYYIQSWIYTIYPEKITSKLREKLFFKFLKQPMAWHDDPQNNPVKLTSVLDSDLSHIGQFQSSFLGILIQVLSTLATSIIITMVASWQLCLMNIAQMPFFFYAAIAVCTAGQEKPIIRKEMDNAAFNFQEALGNIKTLASFSAERYFLKRQSAIFDNAYPIMKQQAILRSRTLALAVFTYFAQYIPLFWVAAALRADDSVSLENLLIGVFCITFAISQMGDDIQILPDIGLVKGALRRVNQYWAIKSNIDIEDPSLSIDVPIKGNIEFKNVGFQYPFRKQNILNNFNLKINAGQKIAIVGQSGVGKSTLLQLLMRFYDVCDGEILIEGINIDKFNLRHLRQQLGFIQQEPVLFKGSIEYNMRYPNKIRDPNILKKLAQLSAIDWLLTNERQDVFDNINPDDLDKGFQIEVGDKGRQISGGQKQRIAIARTLIRNPSVFLFDEATSALDTKNEVEITEALNRETAGKTSLIVAHRMSTIQIADKIAVMKCGRVVEEGTFDELQNIKGYFCELKSGVRKRKANSNMSLSVRSISFTLSPSKLVSPPKFFSPNKFDH